MKKTRNIEEHNLIVTNDVVTDVETGDVLFEEVTCETSTRLPVLRLADNDDDWIGPDRVLLA